MPDSSTGGVGLDRRGVVFQSDNIKDDAQMNMCMATSRVQWLTAKFGNKGGQVVVVYGGELIVDENVLASIGRKIGENQIIKIENSLVGGRDPWYGTRKSCCIYYSESRSPDQGNGLFWRGLFGREGDELDFSTKIETFTWHNRRLEGENFRRAYAAIIAARFGKMPSRLNVDVMDFLKPDPAYNTRKSLVMGYRSYAADLVKERNIWEGHTYYLERDIHWLRYADWFVRGDPSVYRQFFDRIDGISTLTIRVTNEVIGNDPVPGQRKGLTMMFQAQFGATKEASAMEFDEWNVSRLI